MLDLLALPVGWFLGTLAYDIQHQGHPGFICSICRARKRKRRVSDREVQG